MSKCQNARGKHFRGTNVRGKGELYTINGRDYIWLSPFLSIDQLIQLHLITMSLHPCSIREY